MEWCSSTWGHRRIWDMHSYNTSINIYWVSFIYWGPCITLKELVVISVKILPAVRNRKVNSMCLKQFYLSKFIFFLNMKFRGRLLQSWLIQWLNHMIEDSVFLSFLGFCLCLYVIISPEGYTWFRCLCWMQQRLDKQRTISRGISLLRGGEPFPAIPSPFKSHEPEGGRIPNPKII